MNHAVDSPVEFTQPDADMMVPSRPRRIPEWREIHILIWLVAAFAAMYWLPVGTKRFDNAVFESMYLAKSYAREHVVLCLVPALFIAGAIGVFVSQASVMKYLGPTAPKPLAYGVASVSGTILAVCSCTVLPLFAGIWRMGAGLGPATAFLYSGPAINVLAIVLTARVLGLEIGIGRAVGAIGFSVIIGLIMHLIYRREERARVQAAADMPEPEGVRPLGQTAIYFALMVAILVFANWGRPQEQAGFWWAVFSAKWIITSIASAGFAFVLVLWFGAKGWHVLLAAIGVIVAAILGRGEPMVPFVTGVVGLIFVAGYGHGELNQWLSVTWTFAKQIIPLLLGGVLVAGFLLGRPQQEGIIPNSWIAQAVGGNSLWANLFASIVGAFMYFATLTEVPILQGLIGSGMGKGPALALLLAGPALSLPSMIVLKSIMGWQKMIVYVTLVVVIATITGLIYGALF